MKRTKLILALLLFLLPLTMLAEMVQPVQWKTEVEATAPNRAEVRLTAKIAPGWHLYSLREQPDVPVQTTFLFEEVTTVGPTRLLKGKEIVQYDPMFAADVAYYEGEVVFAQTIACEPGWKVGGFVTYMCCNDRSCMQDEYDFTYEVPAFQGAKEPEVSTPREDPAPVQLSKEEVQAASAAAEPDATTDTLTTTTTTTTTEETPAPRENSLWWLFAMGLLAGLLAVFTPCVWPIIPMTVSFFLKRSGAAKGETSSKAIRDAVLYGLSIVFIYVSLGLLITLIFGASALNALSTNAVVNLLFFAVLIVFAASFFGAFELTLPSSWSTKMDEKASKTGGMVSLLFMAFTLVIVSFSCTGPIIGTLLVEAAGKSLLAPMVGMLGFAIALALPFSLFALFPSVMKKMPKSGGWMNTFKVTLAFLELALSLKFFSVADLAYGWHLMDREVFVALWVAIFFLLALYLLGVIAFPHDDEEHRRTSVSRFFLALISLAFSLYLLPGLWGAPLRAVSAFVPPMSTQDWTLGASSVSAAEETTCFTDYEEGLRYAELHHQPVFLDFTGYGCVNCRKMEGAVLTRPEVEERLKGYVYITLYVDDKTPLPEQEKVQEGDRERVLRTYGDKWSHLQRTVYGANAQPFYIQLSEQGEPISSSYAYDESVSAFLDWLKY